MRIPPLVLSSTINMGTCASFVFNSLLVSLVIAPLEDFSPSTELFNFALAGACSFLTTSFNVPSKLSNETPKTPTIPTNPMPTTFSESAGLSSKLDICKGNGY